MRIVITRDGAVVRYVDLGDKDLRIGRSTDSDIVLEDHDKSISRVHAEIRRQGDRITILDLNSQNGVWVKGQRVLTSDLEPGVPVTIGPYSLALEAAARTAAAAVGPASNETQRIDVAKNQTAAFVRPVAPRAATSASATPSAARAAGARVDTLTRLARMPKPKLFAIFGAVALVAVAITATLRPSSSEEATVAEAPSATADAAVDEHLSAAKDLLAAGQPRAAIEEHLDRVLLVAPDHQEALDLKAAAQRVLEGAPVDGALLTRADATATSATAVPAAGAEGASTPGTTAPPSSPSPAPSTTPAAPPAASTPAAVPPAAASPSAPSPRPTAPAPTAPTSPRTARRQPPAEPEASDPPFPRRPGETQTAWRERGVVLQRRYREAMAIFGKADYARAADALQAIAEEQPRYLDVEARLADARARIRGSAATALRAAQDHERGGDLAAARTQYQRALDIDPQLQEATTALAALEARLQGTPEDFYRQARQYDALGYRAEAVDHYERALATLPESDARRPTVSDRVGELRPLVRKAGVAR